MPPPAPDYILPVFLALGSLLLLAMLAWYWRRRAPLRAVRKIAHATDPVAGADALAVLMASLSVTPPQPWQEELQRLRFGPPDESAGERLARLCQGAEVFLKMR